MAEVAKIGPGRSGRRARPLLRRLIGDVLRRRRQSQRRTLADVARHARVSVPYLSEVERGRKEVSSEVLAAVCDALRIDLADLLTEVGRDLVKDRAAVVRLEPVVQSEPVVQLVPVVQLGTVRSRAVRRRQAGAGPTRTGDVVLLAA